MFGWQAVFYIFGAVGLVIAILWIVIAKDLPEQHKMVNEAEKIILLKIEMLSRQKNQTHHGISFHAF